MKNFLLWIKKENGFVRGNILAEKFMNFVEIITMDLEFYINISDIATP